MRQDLTITAAHQLLGLLHTSPTFHSCVLDGADLVSVYAPELCLEYCSLKEMDFSDLVCPGLRVVGCQLERANFQRADLDEAESADCRLPWQRC